VPTIEIQVSERISRHLAAVRLMSYMTFPDSPELRAASEVTFRTKLADWYSNAFAEQTKRAQQRTLRGIGAALGSEPPGALADPCAWMKNKLFSEFLAPLGGAIGGAIALTDSPSASELEREWTRRWFGVAYTGKLVCLIGAINEHHKSVGASLNKAIHVLREIDGENKHLTARLKEFGYPAVYDSSLKKAWRTFKPVAHLCAAYITTEANHYQEELSRDPNEYWLQPPALYEDDVFTTFCLVARYVGQFVTSFRSHGQEGALIPEAEIYALPEAIFDSERSPFFTFRRLTDAEMAALETYRAPKQLV
jgi:hypothetical protein